MRIRTDGERSHRKDEIKRTSEFWDCNKTTALLKSAEFSRRVVDGIEDVLDRDDLTPRQKREIAETLSVPGTLDIDVVEDVDVEIS